MSSTLRVLDWNPFDRGLADTWIGGEPSEAATVFFAGRDDYPDHVVAWISMDNLERSEMNDYAALFAASPDLLGAAQTALDFIVNLKVPQTIAEAGWQVNLAVPVIESLRSAIEKAKRG